LDLVFTVSAPGKGRGNAEVEDEPVAESGSMGSYTGTSQLELDNLQVRSIDYILIDTAECSPSGNFVTAK
jgi:hypothetical protein